MTTRADVSRFIQDTEIPGLISWCLPWVLGLSITSLLVGAQSLISAGGVIMSGGGGEPLLWDLAKGSSYVTLAHFLRRFRQSGKLFVAKHEEKVLGEAMTYLSLSWISLAIVLMTTLAALCSGLASGFFSSVPTLKGQWAPFLMCAATGIVPGIAYIFFRRESRASYASGAFINHINPFAHRSLPRLRFLSVLAIVGGLFALTVGILDLVWQVSENHVGTLLTGLTLTILGCAIQWYRRSVRDIHRNPTPFFFERTLNRLNFLLLVSLVLFVVLFIANFF